MRRNVAEEPMLIPGEWSSASDRLSCRPVGGHHSSHCLVQQRLKLRRTNAAAQRLGHRMGPDAAGQLPLLPPVPGDGVHPAERLQQGVGVAGLRV
jgi:hypothetical protein